MGHSEFYRSYFMKLFIYAAAALSVMTMGATANPIEQRQANMKERGQILRVLAPIAQGRADFDAATVLDALEKLNANAQAAADVDAFYPAGTENGDTKVKENIWSDREGFKKANEDYLSKVAAAAEAKPQDVDAFKAVFGPIGASCGGCHETYRN